MLMKVESEELRNCRRLLDYMDNGFQERLREGRVDFDSPALCGTYSCLWGWFLRDVLETSRGTISGDSAKYFALHGDSWMPLFGVSGWGDIHDRRAVLVAHIERLEQQEKVAA